MTRHSKTLFFPLLFSLILSACGLPSFFATPTPTPVPLPPAIVESDPPAGSVLKPQQAVAFFFNQPMNRASVETTLKLEDGNGIFTWIDDSTVTFTSAAPLAPDSTVTFTLAPGVLAANGLASLEAQIFGFTVTGALRLTQKLPADGASEVSPTSAIVISFNQPVVALGGDPASQPAAFSLEPAASGRGEWLNTSTYIFHPEPALAGGASYRVQPNPALTSTSGGAFENPVAWAFNTSLPRVVQMTPDVDSPVGPQPEITLTFNQPMDTQSIENGGVAVQCDAQGKTPQQWVWNERKSVVTFTLAVPLARGQTCAVQVSVENSRSASGAPLAETFVQNFSSYPRLAIASAPSPAAPKKYQDAFRVTLNAPLDDTVSRSDYVSVSPTVSNFLVAGYHDQINLYGDFLAGQVYIFTLAADLPDVFGATLGAPASFSGASLPPEAAFNISFAPLAFVRPEQPNMFLQVASLHHLQLERATLTLPQYLTLDSDYQAQSDFSFAGAETWQAVTPYLEQMSAYDLSLSPDGTLPTGLYFLRLSSDEVASQYNRSRQMLALSSNVNLTLKVDAKSALVWAVDVRTGQPVSAAQVDIFDQQGVRIGGGLTNAEGLWRGALSAFSLQNSAYAVIGQPGDDAFALATTQLNTGISAWSFGLVTNTDGEKPFVYFYSDRPIYRPGDVIYFHGMARQAFNGRYTDLPNNAQGWTIDLYAISGEALQSSPLTLSPYGAFDGSFTLPETATPGGWYLQVNGNQSPAGYRETYSLYLDVADYHKPELDLAVTFTPTESLPAQPVSAAVQADYFFGSPAPDVPVMWTLYRQSSSFDLPDFQTGKYYGDWESERPGRYGVEVKHGQGRTDANGLLTVSFNDLPADELTTYTLEATTSESGGFPVSARGDLTLHPDRLYAGIRPAQYVGRAGEPMPFTLLAADWQKQAQAGQSLALAWEKVTWQSSITAYGVYTYKLLATPLQTTNVITDGQGLAQAQFTPTEPGTYRLRAQTGNNISEALVWVGGAGQAVWPVLPFDKIQLTAGKNTYQAGETASVFIPNPFDQPARALVTTERGQLLDARLLEIAPGGESVTIALTDDNAPNTFVAVTLLGAGSQFRQGYINLKVDSPKFALTVTVTATPENAHPGERVTLDVRVTDSAGQPVVGEFSLAVVDLAALALADPTAPDILPAFYDSQPLGVRTGLTDAADSRRLFPEPGGMGGGGGEAALLIRSKFPDTALWTTFVTAPDGAAQLALTLPDSLTTWQVDARGLDHQTRVGQARLRLVTSKELLLRPITPRYFVAGDHARVGTAVNNTTDKDFTAEVTLDASGFVLDEKQVATQKVSVPAGGRALVWWWGQARPVENARLLFSAKAGNWSDATLPSDGDLPIVAYSAPQTFSTAGVLSTRGARREIISLPRKFEALDAELRLELTPSLGAYLLQAADALRVPDEFSSNEEVASYLLAVLALSDSGAQVSIPQAVTTGAQTLLTHQSGDGGWEWYWSNRYDSISDPRLTAYVLLALDAARAKNALPPGDWAYILRNAHEFLSKEISARRPVAEMNAAEMDELAFLIYAHLNDFDPELDATWTQPLLSGMTERGVLLSPASQAMNYVSLSKLGSEQAGLLSTLEQNAQRSATGAFWQAAGRDAALPVSSVYQTAVALTVLAQHQPVSPLTQDALRFLVFSRAPNGGWNSGMETAWAFRALAAMLRASGDLQSSYTFAATLNGAAFTSGQGQALVKITKGLDALYLRSPNELILQRNEGAGQLFYRADLTVLRPAQDAPAINQGITISRAYFDCSGVTCQPIQSWKMGETAGRVTTRVTLTLPYAMYYINVEDFAPAGAEIANPSLKTSQQGQISLEEEFFAPEDPFARGWGWWSFTPPQIYRDHVRWSAPYLDAGTYVLTYTLVPSLAGEYQVLPAHAWQSFFPEVQGTSAGSIFSITP
ncbi:hypothetical protein GW781_01555 [bacterium]|nr:hypothetical protein [bacterium]NCT19821.1 hypothetical protein [bacterium]OIO84971.1 MAG: hypothetical protein AUK01_07625 [Anaerolineae bacterium CG2_30_57_67]